MRSSMASNVEEHSSKANAIARRNSGKANTIARCSSRTKADDTIMAAYCSCKSTIVELYPYDCAVVLFMFRSEMGDEIRNAVRWSWW